MIRINYGEQSKFKTTKQMLIQEKGKLKWWESFESFYLPLLHILLLCSNSHILSLKTWFLFSEGYEQTSY